MINPALGTEPRPDVTGMSKYAGVSGAGDPLKLGVNRALGNVADPWNGVKIRWDFPEDKFPVTGYQILVGNTPGFNDPIDPLLEPGPDNDKQWGMAGVAPPGALVTTITGFTPYLGDPLKRWVLEPGQQVYIRIRPEGGNASELVGTSLAALPHAGLYPEDAVFPIDRPTGEQVVI